jgi:predicted cupin superfamily sugar epimerase
VDIVPRRGARAYSARMSSRSDLVRALDLAPHPEGGFYRETYRSREVVPTARGPRAASTAILFLVARESFSALHRIASDEVWHFHAGTPLRVVCIAEDGTRSDHVLGLDLARGERPQAVVPAGTWFGARLEPGDADFALVSCTVAPGFDFADFELAERAALRSRFPEHAVIIDELTRAM